MRDDRLDEILENTRTVKTVVVSESEQRRQEQERKKEQTDKRKEQLKNAQQKFKKIGANLKQEQADKIKEKCDAAGVSVNEYVKRLIDADTQKPKTKQAPESKPKQDPTQKKKSWICRFLSRFFGCNN